MKKRKSAPAGEPVRDVLGEERGHKTRGVVTRESDDVVLHERAELLGGHLTEEHHLLQLEATAIEQRRDLGRERLPPSLVARQHLGAAIVPPRQLVQGQVGGAMIFTRDTSPAKPGILPPCKLSVLHTRNGRRIESEPHECGRHKKPIPHREQNPLSCCVLVAILVLLSVSAGHKQDTSGLRSSRKNLGIFKYCGTSNI